MKSDTAEELGRIYNAVITVVSAQLSIGRPIESQGMDLFNHLVVDARTRLEWESSTCDSTESPSHTALLEFISKRILALNAARPNTAAKAAEPSRTAKTHVAKQRSDPQCSLCKDKHTLMNCAKFKAKPASERKSFVDTSRLCYNCFGNHAVSKCQSTRNCYTCKSRHHTLLHGAYDQESKPEAIALSAVRRTDDRKAVLLATARVTVADRYGEPTAARVLINQGSEVSIIAESLVQWLRLQRSQSSALIFGIRGSKSCSTRGKVTVMLTSIATGATISIVALVLPRLSLYQGSIARRSSTWPHIKGLKLADPRFFAKDPVELLLGAEVCSIILEDGIRKGGPQAPIAQKTTLGWILSGGCDATEYTGPRTSHQCTTDHELGPLVRRFWEQETESTAPAELTPEERKCEKFFAHTNASPMGGTSSDCRSRLHPATLLKPAGLRNVC